MNEIRLPAIILVRDGSKRLPHKWKLKWHDTSLLGWCIRQLRRCEYVGRIIVAGDHADIGACAELAGAEYVNQRPNGEPVPDTQKSIEGLRYVQSVTGLDASYVLLAQCTSPFVNPEDLSRLVLCSDLPCNQVTYLGKKGKPSGMGYIFPPFIDDNRGPYVEQDAPDVDVDTMADYERALELCQRS